MSGLPAHLLPLLRPEAYPHAVADLRLIETHISWVLLTGELAYKLKRPVHYPFVDLRSAEHRSFLCAEEVRLNRRFAPQLYLGVGSLVMDGRPLGRKLLQSSSTSAWEKSRAKALIFRRLYSE